MTLGADFSIRSSHPLKVLLSFCIALGTRVEDAKAILAASALRMFASDDLDNAAAMVRFPFVFILVDKTCLRGLRPAKIQTSPLSSKS